MSYCQVIYSGYGSVEAAVRQGLEIVDLRDLVGRELDPLLLEETVEWQRELDWDFARSADLVRQFADMRRTYTDLRFSIAARWPATGIRYSRITKG